MVADLASYFSFVSLTLSRQMLTYDRRIPLPELDRRIEVRRQNSGFTISGDPALYCTIIKGSVAWNRAFNPRYNRTASSPGAVAEAKKEEGARGLMGRDRIAKQSHNSTGTTLNDPTTQWAPHSKRERRLGTRQITEEKGGFMNYEASS